MLANHLPWKWWHTRKDQAAHGAFSLCISKQPGGVLVECAHIKKWSENSWVSLYSGALALVGHTMCGGYVCMVSGKVRLPMQETQEMWTGSLGWEDPLEEEMVTHSVFLPGKFHGQRSLVGYSSWGLRRVRHEWAYSTKLRNTNSVILMISHTS